MTKMIIYDNGETVSIYEEIIENVKEALKIVDWKKVKESDKLNEVILGYLRVNGNSTIQALVAMMSFLLDMPQNKIENWIENNRFIKCYTYYTDEYFESIGMSLDIINYLNYMDVIVFDSVLTAQAIKIGANIRENIIEETSNSKKIYKL